MRPYLALSWHYSNSLAIQQFDNFFPKIDCSPAFLLGPSSTCLYYTLHLSINTYFAFTMGKKSLNIKKLKPAQRKTIRLVVIFFFTLLFLQIGLYFGSDLLLRNYLQREVAKLSDGKYAIDFDRFNLSIFERGFYVRGFVLTPLDDHAAIEQRRPLYKITIPEISVKSLGYNFTDDILTIGNLRFYKPSVQSRQDQDFLEDQQASPLELLETEVRKSFKDGLQNIIVENLHIEGADLLLENFISQRSIKADNTNLYVKHMELLTSQSDGPPFNAKGFALDLQNFEIALSDSVHTVKSTSIKISSLDQFIKAEKVSISPDFSKAAETYYEIGLENLEVAGADIDQIFYT